MGSAPRERRELRQETLRLGGQEQIKERLSVWVGVSTHATSEVLLWLLRACRMPWPILAYVPMEMCVVARARTSTHILLAPSHRDTGDLSKLYGSDAVTKFSRWHRLLPGHRNTTGSNDRLCLPRGQINGIGDRGAFR